jgi:SAM-dependent methyltransferase
MTDSDSLPQSAFATSFNSIAALYAAARPGYPPAVFETLEEIAGRPLAGADVLDVGAGTGIGTRLLRELGARVTAVEPGEGMAAQLRAGQPDVRLVRADGNALPFGSGVADFVTYAQAWHWTDPARSVPEAVRALRTGGALALWWNKPDLGVGWAAEQQERLRRRLATYHSYGLSRASTTESIIGIPGPPLHIAERELRWTRRVSLDAHLANLATHSYFSVLGQRERDEIFADERAELSRLFPDGIVEEPYRVDLTVAVKTSPS